MKGELKAKASIELSLTKERGSHKGLGNGCDTHICDWDSASVHTMVTHMGHPHCLLTLYFLQNYLDLCKHKATAKHTKESTKRNSAASGKLTI